MTYTVGEPDVGSSVISAEPTTIVADGQTSSVVKVQLKDKFGNNVTSGTNPATGTAYDLKIVIKNTPAVSNATITTVNNDDGTFTAKVTSEKTGTDTFTFELDSVRSSAETQVSYTPGGADLTVSTINADPASITADGIETTTITVQLKDKFGNNLTTQSGDVVITGVNVATQAASAITASYIENGKYTVTLSSTKTGTDGTIGFKLDNNAGSDTTSVTYTAGLVDLAQSTISVSPSSIVANNTDKSTVTIQLKDSNGNNLTASSGSVVLAFNTANTNTAIGIIDKDIVDNGDGTYTAVLKSTKTGKDDIGFRLDNNLSQNTAPLTYTPGSVDLTKSTIVASPSTIEANDSDESIITVQLKDAYGNNLTTNEGEVKLFNYNFGEVNKGNSATLTYKGNGYYQGSVTSTKTGTDSFRFTLAGTENDPSIFANVTYKTGGASLTQSTITASPTTITADGSAESTITVQLKDQFGNNLTAQEGNVYFVNLSTGYPSLEDNFELSYISDGRYQAKIKSTTSGSDNIGYKLGTSESSASQGTAQVTVTYTPGDVDFTQSTIVASPASITANNVARSTVTVQLKDKNGNKITTDQGAMVLTGLDIGKANNTDKSLTFQSDGSYTATVTSTQTGSDDAISFTLTGKGDGTQKTSITYTAGTVNLENSTITAAPATITANYSDTSIITIQFKDAFGNNLAGDVTGTVALTGINVGVGETKVALHSIGNGAYQAEVYSKVAGVDNIGFTLDGASGGKGTTAKASVTYTSGTADLTQSTIVANPTKIVANGTTTSKITVQLKDQFGNNLTAASPEEVKIFISSASAYGTLKDITNNNDGSYTALVASTTTGEDTFGFSINGVASSNEANVTYIAGSASATKSEIVANPTSIIVNDVDTTVITVQLKDENGNNLTSSIGKAVSISTPVTGVTVYFSWRHT
ncbi:beta strand repeat-containing protein [Orbus mooreae]|uniref:beta strand repeat-containing protein n=1 Tax=Orbus mooreae TaxID=3074107 RepID=UPI00370DA350